MIPAPAFKDKHIAVLGLGRTGLATARALQNAGAHVALWDDVEAARNGLQVQDLNTADWTQFDALIPSPGIPTKNAIIQAAKRAGVPVFGDLEVFQRARATLPPHQVVVVTGTNGKSTTTALLAHLLAHAGRPTAMGGNIGAAVMGLDSLPREGVYVLEASSYQLEQSVSVAADIAILLNITPDHLDRHGGFDGYRAAKAHVFAMQHAEQVAILGADDEPCRQIADTLKDRRLIKISTKRPIPCGVYVLNGKLIDDMRGHAVEIASQENWPALQGEHNAQNVAAAAAAARVLGLSAQAIADGLATYQALPHRMEPLGTYQGVMFINDSKATNAEACVKAVSAFDRVHWILGGIAKSGTLGPLEDVLPHVAKAYLIGEAEALYAGLLQNKVTFERCGTLDKAVALAAQNAKPGEVVLLSPACASQDQYRDYAERGEHFRSLFQDLEGRGA